jgi:coenzyme PQQ precursor peptide PqqA
MLYDLSSLERCSRQATLRGILGADPDGQPGGPDSITECGDPHMTWSTPAYTDIRLGFEVTMYIYNR